MKFGSLFTGVGGFDLGFERAGMECVWQVEFDKHCQSVLKEHWDVPIYEDVRNVGKHNLESVNLICGGFPCQDLSVAGKRAGFDGERSSLWFEYERIIDELRPQWVVIENVPGLLSSKKGADFGVILQSLDEFGYGVAWRVLDSQYFGVPQRRRRVFIVGSLGNTSCGQVLFESDSVSGDFTPSKQERKAVAKDTVSSIEQRCYKGINSDNLDHMVANTLAGGSSKAHSDISSGQQDKNIVLCMASGQANAEIDSERSPSLTGLHEQPVVWQFWSHNDEYRSIDHTLPTVSAAYGTGGNNMPFVGVRRLTPTECERLQGFPDGWTASQSDTQRYKQMGNAVTVNVIEWIGKRIINNEDCNNAENNRTV